MSLVYVATVAVVSIILAAVGFHWLSLLFLGGLLLVAGGFYGVVMVNDDSKVEEYVAIFWTGVILCTVAGLIWGVTAGSAP